ncbi:MAG: ferrous iron transport protein B [Acidobacteria bacterium]|nr:ferrous iron transport protein B [Acidobacteriota bacterium]
MPAVRAGRPVVAIVGNPNTGKTTVFNALTGLSQKVGNYPGVTVERISGTLRLGAAAAELVDLPGTYSLSARSPDELIAVDILLGQQPGEAPVDVVVAVIDASNPERNLFLLSQLLELGRPLVVALNMTDAARRRGLELDARALSERLGVAVVPMRADRGEGVDELRRAIARALEERRVPAAPEIPFPPEYRERLARLTAHLFARRAEIGREVSRVEAMRLLAEPGGAAERRIARQLGAGWRGRHDGPEGRPAGALEADARYRWAHELISGTTVRRERVGRSLSERVDALLTHRVFGLLALVATLGLVFQAIYAGAAPAMDLIGAGFDRLAALVSSAMDPGPLRSLLVDGVIGGAGMVVTFLPQILVLFFFLSVLEDCGYMARVAFLVDRLFAWAGLSGKSAFALLSSFACAVPGVMAARTIEHRRDRLATILIAPLMSCSARLPVYVLMIGAFVPDRYVLGGVVSVRALCLLAAHLVGLAVAVPILWVLRRTILRGPAAPFVMELPEYRWPSWLSVLDRLQIRARAFVVRAGTVIVALAIVVWALAYFPRPAAIHENYEALRAAAASAEEREALDRQEASAYLRQSVIGRAGHAIEPLVRPLGWDWRIGMAVIASFPAREVVIATLGTIFGMGEGGDAGAALAGQLAEARRPDGAPLFTMPVALSLVVFFALCCQCAATLAVIRRESGSWGWAAFTFGYMTVLAYAGALLTYHLALRVAG